MSSNSATPLNSNSAPKDSSNMARSKTFSIIAWVAGFITVTVCLAVQMFTVSHGTSGQLSIDSGMKVGLWPALLAASLIAVGVALWILFENDERYKYLYLFAFAFSSYVVAIFSLFLSTRQVTVANN